MSESFDPYLKWLGIRDSERPPNHYRLLGLDLFESDPEVINGAADRQMSHVRSFQTGPKADVSQALLNELAVARRCLLDDDRRADYDRQLKSGSTHQATSQAVPPVIPAKIIQPANPVARSRRSRPAWVDLAGWVGGGLTAVVVAYFLINSSWLNDKPKVADGTVVNDGGARTAQPKDGDPVEPGPRPSKPDSPDPPNTANLPDGPAEQPPEKGDGGGAPVKQSGKRSLAEELMDGVWRIEWSNKVVYTDVRFHPDGRFTGISSYRRTAMKDNWQPDGDQVVMGRTIFREVDGQIIADDPRYQGVLTKRAVAGMPLSLSCDAAASSRRRTTAATYLSSKIVGLEMHVDTARQQPGFLFTVAPSVSSADIDSATLNLYVNQFGSEIYDSLKYKVFEHSGTAWTNTNGNRPYDRYDASGATEYTISPDLKSPASREWSIPISSAAIKAAIDGNADHGKAGTVLEISLLPSTTVIDGLQLQGVGSANPPTLEIAGPATYNQSEPLVKKPADTEAPMESPAASDTMAVAPWDEAGRLPELPDFITKPNNNADRRFQPVYVGLANRKYDWVKLFYPKVEEFDDQLSQPVDVESVVNQLEEFWQLVRRSAVDVRPGDTLSFRNRDVRVAAVSDLSIELEWLPESGDDRQPVVERFSTRQDDMDRDLAVALAAHDSSSESALIDNFRRYDYHHAKLPNPPELSVGAEVRPNEMTGVLGDDPSVNSPVPDKESVREQRNTIRELYETDFAKVGFLPLQELAHTLLNDAQTTRTDAMRYALLDEAGQLGARIGDGEIVFTALSEMDSDFEIEFWEALAKQMRSAQKNASTAMHHGTITRALFEAVERAVQQENYETALQMANDGLKAARKLGVENQVRAFDDYQKQLREMVEWSEEGADATDKLEADPDDSKAHLAAARQLCFVQGDWDQGLEHLAQCGSSKLERLARQDQALSADQAGTDRLEEILALADQWFETGQNNKGATARALLVRAHHWYGVAKNHASDLDRQKAVLRLNQLQPWLAFFDAYRDDEVFVQSQQWRFGTQGKVVFQAARFRGSVFEYDQPTAGNNRRTRPSSIDLTKAGDTYQIEPDDTNSRVYLRLMRDGRIELLQYSLESGQLLAAGWGEPIKP